MALLFSNPLVSVGNTKDQHPAMASQNDDKDLQVASLLRDFLFQFISSPEVIHFYFESGLRNPFPVESSSMPSRFRFRDHHEIQNPMQSEPSSDVSSVSSDRDSEPEIESMTGKGIKHLCSELLELKAEASEDLHRSIFENYSAFIRILEEVKGVESELAQLENHFATHKRLIKDLVDRIYPKIYSEETLEPPFEDHTDDVLSSPGELEVHLNDVLENLDILLSENRIDEALDHLESAEEYYQSIQSDDSSPHKEIMLYNSMISERKSMLILKLTQIAEDPKTAAPGLQKILAGLWRIGDSQLAVHLLLKYYHSRIVNGTNSLQWSKSFSNGIYIRELARFVFSMISQAARSFVILCGETSPYASELMLWACEETKSFVSSLDKYVKSISQVSGGLPAAIKAVQSTVSYCTLLENQKLVLQPYLLRHLSPCMEEVLHQHINHFKKVISIFSVSDPWVLESYLVSGVFGGGYSSLAVGQRPEYCLLTNSGRKFLTLLQAVIDDIAPLVALQMGSSVIDGLMSLFTEYISILERVLTNETSVPETGSSRIKIAESLPQKISILANMSMVVQFLSVMVKIIFRGISDIGSHSMENHSDVCQQKELDDFLLLIEEGSNKLRYIFCQQFIQRVFSTYSGHELISVIHSNDQFDANTSLNLVPSDVFQGFFLELRKLEQLTEENNFEGNWMKSLLKELMESMFVWLSENREIRASKNASIEHDDSKQFVLDVQFLVEIGMHGGYFFNDPLRLLTLMKSIFLSAGLYPFRDVNNDEWAIEAATKAIHKLLKIEKADLSFKQPVVIIEEESEENQSTHSSECSKEDDINSPEGYIDAEDTMVTEDDSEVPTEAKMASRSIEYSPGEASSDLLEMKKVHVQESTLDIGDSTIQLQNTESETAAEVAPKEDSVGIEGGDVGDCVEFETLDEGNKIYAEDGDKTQMQELQLLPCKKGLVNQKCQ